MTVACVDAYRGVFADVGARWKIGVGPVGWERAQTPPRFLESGVGNGG